MPQGLLKEIVRSTRCKMCKQPLQSVDCGSDSVQLARKSDDEDRVRKYILLS